MANWEKTLNIKNEWRAAANGEISHEELGVIIAEKIRDLHMDDEFDDERLSIADDFEKNGYSDGLMSDLYDWADGSRVWIATA